MMTTKKTRRPKARRARLDTDRSARPRTVLIAHVVPVQKDGYAVAHADQSSVQSYELRDVGPEEKDES